MDKVAPKIHVVRDGRNVRLIVMDSGKPVFGMEVKPELAIELAALLTQEARAALAEVYEK